MKISAKILAIACAALSWRFTAADCECSDYYTDGNANKPFDISIKELSFSNVALEMMHITLSTIDSTGAEPHKIAMIAAAMYEQYAVFTGKLKPLEQEPSATIQDCDANCENLILKAGYFALKIVLTGEPIPPMVRRYDKFALADAKVRALLGSRMLDCTFLDGGVPIVGKILGKFNIFNIFRPPSDYYPGVAVNPASTMFDADCDTLVELDKWQAQCVQNSPGKECEPQKIPFLPLDDAKLLSTGLSNVETVLNGNKDFGGLGDPVGVKNPKDLREFLEEHKATLAKNGALTDVDKFNAEYFMPNGAVLVQKLALDEAEARELDLQDSITLLFAVGGAVRDAIIGAVTQKLTFDTVRPITVLQCADKYGEDFEEEINGSDGWAGPYRGATPSMGRKFRPYLQTPPFPGFPSGHSVAAGAAATVMDLFFEGDDTIYGGNCAAQKAGTSMIEPKILKGAAGYIEGMTDIPNDGPQSVGYSPASDLEICWETFEEYAKALSDSRLAGGIHIPKDNELGIAFGNMMGVQFLEFL